MENASKALIIAGEVLIGMLVVGVAVMVILSMREPANKYEETLGQQEIMKFNSNITKYGEKLTAQDVVTIANFIEKHRAKETPYNVTLTGGAGTSAQVNTANFLQESNHETTYKITILDYYENGLIKTVRINEGI